MSAAEFYKEWFPKFLSTKSDDYHDWVNTCKEFAEAYHAYASQIKPLHWQPLPLKECATSQQSAPGPGPRCPKCGSEDLTRTPKVW